MSDQTIALLLFGAVGLLTVPVGLLLRWIELRGQRAQQTLAE
jgi:hypothetical protein